MHLHALQDVALKEDKALGHLDLTITSRINNMAKVFFLMESKVIFQSAV